MQKRLAVILVLLAIVGGVYLAVSITISNLLSPERLRVMLVEPVEEQLGRKVEIGAVKVSLFSGIEIKDIVIKEKDPAREFFSINTFRLKYELLPLLEKRLVIKEVLLQKPTIRVIRDSQGVFNFADLSLKPRKIKKEVPPPEQQTVKPLPLALIFDQIRITDLNLTFKDQTGALPAITSTDGDLICAVTIGKTLAETSYKGTLDLLVNTAFNGSKPVLLLKSEISNQLISFRGEATVFLDRLQFNGQLANYLTAPDLTLNLQGASLDLEKLAGLKPAGPKPARPTNQAVAEPPQAAPPGEARKFRAHGQIGINEVRRAGLRLQNLKLNYSFADQVLELTELSAGLFGGAINGKAGIGLGRPAPDFRGQLRADKLQMAAAMEALGKPKGYLTGELSGDFAGQGTGTAWPVIRNSLVAQGKFAIVKGGLASSPISQAFASLLGIPELDNLKFDTLAGTVQIAGGRAALEATLDSALLSMQTSGHAGLDGSLDLPLLLQLSPTYSQRLQEKAAFARYLADSSGRTTLSLKLKGTVDRPDLSLDREVATAQAKRILEKKASEELSRALSKKLGGLGSQEQKAAGDTADQLLRKLLGN